ncbi:GNAT family N-acetyltransferase [Cochlodiniinecator piscidefendens]|uniref:GNAT family N-acetyltransferase n=1 Tax=Cochlodiniinecator piscidefendens TaxID=2715756 RepID=UPI00140CB81F|nr:GNAT family N-acetyltransferase [Cochlodiniinecator piscidefendens]
MTLPSVETLYEVCEATWAPASKQTVGNWTVRDGQGGGQRMSAATRIDSLLETQFEQAEQAMVALGQAELFMIRDGEEELDTALENRGYIVKDPVNLMVCPVDTLATDSVGRLSAFTIWPPMHIMQELWLEGEIGPERVAGMIRAKGKKTTVLGRQNDRAAGVAYVAIHNGIAMLHGLEVTQTQRRQGVAKNIMIKAAQWAKENGATHLAIIVVQQNVAANALYSSLGLECVGQYHYRVKQ